MCKLKETAPTVWNSKHYPWTRCKIELVPFLSLTMFFLRPKILVGFYGSFLFFLENCPKSFHFKSKTTIHIYWAQLSVPSYETFMISKCRYMKYSLFCKPLLLLVLLRNIFLIFQKNLNKLKSFITTVSCSSYAFAQFKCQFCNEFSASVQIVKNFKVVLCT